MRASLIGLVEVFGENRIVLIVSSEGVLEKWAFFAHQSRDCVRKSEDRIRRSAVFSMECGSAKKTARHAQCVRAVCGSDRAYFSRKYPFGEQ